MRGGHVRPRPAVVARELHLAVARARPDHAASQRRLGDRGDREPRNPAGHAALGFGEDARLVIRAQVRADLRPRRAAVGRPQQHLRAGVNHVAVVRGNMERRDPLEAIWIALRPLRPDVRLVAELLIDARVPAVLPRRVQPPAVARIDLGEHAVVVADGQPVPHGHAAERPVRRSLPVLVILESGVDVVRVFHVHADRVDLGHRQVGEVVAGPAAVVRDRRSRRRCRQSSGRDSADRSRASGNRRTCAGRFRARSRCVRRRVTADTRPA